MNRAASLLVLALVMTACVSRYGASSRPTPVPFITPPDSMPAPDASVEPTPLATAISPSPPPGPPAAAVPTTPPMLSRSFALIPVRGSFVSGVVQVVERNGALSATVSARGLPGGTSLHAVHIHLGSCANPYGGMHLTVLGLLASDGAGIGSVTSPLASVYASAGHYVIVYSTASPQVIVACANLAALG